MIASAATGLAGTSLSAARRLRSSRTSPSRTGGTGGVYYPLGGGMANVLSKTLPGHAGDARA